jgi:hypothetical protein
LYIACVTFRDFIDNFRNVGGAQAIAAKINFQEELFNLEQKGEALPNRTTTFEHPLFFNFKYACREIKIMITTTGTLKLLVLTMTF